MSNALDIATEVTQQSNVGLVVVEAHLAQLVQGGLVVFVVRVFFGGNGDGNEFIAVRRCLGGHDDLGGQTLAKPLATHLLEAEVRVVRSRGGWGHATDRDVDLAAGCNLASHGRHTSGDIIATDVDQLDLVGPRLIAAVAHTPRAGDGGLGRHGHIVASGHVLHKARLVAVAAPHAIGDIATSNFNVAVGMVVGMVVPWSMVVRSMMVPWSVVRSMVRSMVRSVVRSVVWMVRSGSVRPVVRWTMRMVWPGSMVRVRVRWSVVRRMVRCVTRHLLSLRHTMVMVVGVVVRMHSASATTTSASATGATRMLLPPTAEPHETRRHLLSIRADGFDDLRPVNKTGLDQVRHLPRVDHFVQSVVIHVVVPEGGKDRAVEAQLNLGAGSSSVHHTAAGWSTECPSGTSIRGSGLLLDEMATKHIRTATDGTGEVTVVAHRHHVALIVLVLHSH